MSFLDPAKGSRVGEETDEQRSYKFSSYSVEREGQREPALLASPEPLRWAVLAVYRLSSKVTNETGHAGAPYFSFKVGVGPLIEEPETMFLIGTLCWRISYVDRYLCLMIAFFLP